MKIAHLTSAHPKEDIRILGKECASLAKVYDVSLIVWGQEGGEYEGVKIINSGEKSGSRYTRFIKGAKTVYKKALEIDADIYHIHDPELLPYANKLKKKGKKVIYDAHEDVPRQIMAKYWIPIWLRKVVSSVFESFENRSARKYDYIIAATPTIRKRFEKINPNTIDVNNFPSFKDIVFSEDWAVRENAIVYIGGITEVRGIKELVKAVQFGDYPLNSAGRITPISLKEEIEQLDEKKMNQYEGVLDRSGVNNILAKSKVGMVTLHDMPNHVESLPVKMFEYMAAGIPVIASDFPLWRQIVEDADCGLLVDPMNPKAIFEAVETILKDDSRAQQMGLNGRKAALEQYNWDNEAKKLLQVYKSL